MKKSFSILVCTLVCLFCVSSWAQALPIRVALNTKATTVNMAVAAGSYTVTGGLTAKELGVLNDGEILVAKYGAGGQWQLTLGGQDLGNVDPPITLVAKDGDNLIRYSSKRYRGNFGLMTGGLVVNILDMEDYLKGVVGKEIGYSVPDAALQAQAIASRSYAYTCLKNSGWYDVVNTTTNQVYGGYDAETVTNGAKVVAAVEATKDQVMYYKVNGNYKLVEAYFHAHAGGHTENVENVWGGTDYPYLRGVESPYDSSGPAAYNSWTVTYTASEMTNLVKKYKPNSNFGDFVSIAAYYDGTVSGRVSKVVVTGTSGSVTVERDAIRRFLGGLKSTLFTIDSQATGTTSSGGSIHVTDYFGKSTSKEASALYVEAKGQSAATLSDTTSVYVEGANGAVKNVTGPTVAANNKITITGKGWGHGVGMSQWGAIGMAKDGYSCKEILQHYYGGGQPSNLIITEVGAY